MLAGLALVVFSPLIAVLALLVKIDGGSIFLRRRRVGRDGAELWTYAFRSEAAEADRRRDGLVTRNANGQLDVTFKVNGGMRLTKVGRLLRKTNLDEMPKFWNILRGEMSFFGD
ncbi:sugar transferase [Singulisphaera sp. PoT]|uniref:sugar transferase n=1 Tax=Singulisphaera sp. PoT TaxID=3411797 RepID=UPI003BF5F178